MCGKVFVVGRECKGLCCSQECQHKYTGEVLHRKAIKRQQEQEQKRLIYDELKKKWREIEEKYDDWQISDYGKNMEQLGITNYLTHDTIYGDWSCTTFDIDTKKSIGQFCADAGEVSVFSLKEIRAYNPNIDKWIEEHSWCVTKIPNFTGDVYIDVENTSGVYDEDNEYHKKGEAWEEHTVRVIGKGSVNFRTEQTGF